MVAVCQPCPAALAAVALMAEDGEAAVPRTLTLMAGPVDTRVSPTEVDDLATGLPLSWFEDWAITTVPARYRGGGRRVYPGFVQLAGFMGMHPERHLDAHLELFADLVAGDAEAARVTTDFYDEYLAVLDVAAEFYLDTIDRVFQRHLLGKGELTWRGRPVRPAAITTTGLLTVEGGATTSAASVRPPRPTTSARRSRAATTTSSPTPATTACSVGRPGRAASPRWWPTSSPRAEPGRAEGAHPADRTAPLRSEGSLRRRSWWWSGRPAR